MEYYNFKRFLIYLSKESILIWVMSFVYFLMTKLGSSIYLWVSSGNDLRFSYSEAQYFCKHRW